MRLGSSTVGAVGCLATCYAQAVRHLGIDDDFTPADVVERGAFQGAAMIQATTAGRLGLVAGDVHHVAVRSALAAALSSGAVIVMHVDHRGDSAADHFVLATSVTGDDVDYADPATGKMATLSLSTLEGSTVWGSTAKTYRVRSVRQLNAAR